MSVNSGARVAGILAGGKVSGPRSEKSASHVVPRTLLPVLILLMATPARAHTATVRIRAGEPTIEPQINTVPTVPSMANERAVIGFTDIAAGLSGVDRSSVAWGDYDNDGDLEH
jgi:hypothetical protein